MASPARRRKPRRQDAQLAFEALQIEGGLLAPEWLAKIARLDADGQTEADYGVAKGLSLRDEIARFWRVAQAHWADFVAGRDSGADPGPLAEQFVVGLLRQALGFASLVPVPPVVLDERTYPIGHAALQGRVPVVVAPAGQGLDTPSTQFGEDGRRRTAFGLLQEHLNAAQDALWGIASDGLVLRIARDNASLTRPAWIAADLARIFADELYADFAALWLLVHQSRFAAPEGRPPTDCPLETWREAGRQEGTRALGQLRTGVTDALLALGNGFMSHPENGALRTALERGDLDRRELFDQLLRLVYRLIFLLTVEERGLLHPEDAPDAARKLYADGYGLRRLRERSVRRAAHDRHADLWEGAKIAFRGLATGEPRLGLPALSGLFAPAQCAALDASRLENRALLLAVFKLSWLRDDAGLSRVNWRDMGPEELGSVYESLLELDPQPSVATRSFAFGGDDRGNARKTTGSYYTPDSLVQVLLDSALEPVVKDTIAANPGKAVEALLSLSIVDPACGSGHFLLAAARRLAAHVARLQAQGAPSAADFRRALRQVVSRCVYGVDLNPMAVELCKVALWMEAVEPGTPLTFLDAHIQVGNALLGATPELLDGGIPDAAWAAIEGDDKKVASALKKRNKQEAAGQTSFVWSKASKTELDLLRKATAELDEAPDEELGQLFAKESRWSAIRSSAAYRHQKLVADAWCAAFVWPKPASGGEIVEAAPTAGVWRDLRDGRAVRALTVETVADLAEQYQFFHWHLAFPTVFAKGGFDVVLGNPPWERVKLQEQEFFASRSDEIAAAPNAASRKKLIAALPESDPTLWIAWCDASREAQGHSQLIRGSGRYPLCGKGDINTYALFAEHNRAVLAERGRAGFIVPTNLATDDTTKDYFGELVSNRQLASFFSFENEEFIFPSVHHAFKFALLTVDLSGRSTASDLVFFARQVADLRDAERHFSLSPQEFELLNPNTRTCPTFRSKRDVLITLSMHERAGILHHERREDGNPWGIRLLEMIHMANDSRHFLTATDSPSPSTLPLYESKMMHLYDHRFGSYATQSESQKNQGKLPETTDEEHSSPHYRLLPQYHLPRDLVDSALRDRWSRPWLLVWRKICRSTDQRTWIGTILPYCGAANSMLAMLPAGAEPEDAMCLLANLASIPGDYSCRQKVGGTNFSFNYMRQIPTFPPARYHSSSNFSEGPLRAWVAPRVLELTYTAWDLNLFARDVGWDGPPFRWDPERRFQLRCELDAAFFHLYDLNRDDTAYIMDTFPIVRKNDEKAHGEYRTKRVVLEIYDAMAEAARTGVPYQSPLDPPPGPPTRPDGSFVSYAEIADHPPPQLHPPRAGTLEPV